MIDNADPISGDSTPHKAAPTGASLSRVISKLHIVAIDDSQAHLTLIKRILEEAGYKKISLLQDSIEVMNFVQREQPDLLLLDMNMPGVNGLDIIRQLQHLNKDDLLPILVLTAEEDTSKRQQALALGALDVIAKPLDKNEVRLRVRNALRLRSMHLALHMQNNLLSRRNDLMTSHNIALNYEKGQQQELLEKNQLESLMLLARVAEYRDNESNDHIWRVANLSGRLAKEMGFSPNFVDMIVRASRLHDIGKVSIPDKILFKPSALTSEEFELVKRHTTVGAELLSGSQTPLIGLAQEIALNHHEKWDGSGYPRQLKGKNIPMVAHIVALADSFDTMTHDRPYKEAKSTAEAVIELESLKGSWFNPDLVDAFMNILGDNSFILEL